MLISDRIFDLLREKGMTQKEFAERTGIAESSISSWKRMRTNPSADKILIICDVLGVTPGELLSGSEREGSTYDSPDYMIITKDSSVGRLVQTYQKMDLSAQRRLEGYLMAMHELYHKNDKKE
ncbi:MAG: helix-turn-helix transcriptional regulator [Eubacteriales bacterium]|nr:helix-turn-helix transcriptional regulator [Eubacteriales bacterium]